MAGKAIGVQFLVTGYDLARADHEVWIGERQHGQYHQVHNQNDLQQPTHFHPQNRKMLTMCPSPNTAKTMKMGMCTLRQRVIAS